nr:cell envelope biogenesis protein TolA [Sphingomonas gei]
MTRSEMGGLAVAAALHVALFKLLSVGLAPKPEMLVSTPIAVSFAEDVALESAAPVISSEAEAAKKSPVEAPVEPESAPPEPVAEPEPEPVAKPQPAPPKPAPAPAAKPKPALPAKPAPSKPAAKPAAPAKPAASAPASNSRRPVRPTGNLDGLDLGRTNNRNDGTATTPPAAKMSTQAAANIGSAIQRQVQPCADRQVNPGPGADQIRVVVNLRINRDGSLAGAPRIIDHIGVDDANKRYVERVDDAVRAIFAGCSPLRGLPAELYEVPNGWKSFTLRYRLKS